MGNIKKLLLAFVAIILLLVIFILVRGNRIPEASIKSIDKIISHNGHTLFYSGEVNKDTKKMLKEISKKYSVKVYIFTDKKEDVITYIRSRDAVQDYQGNLILAFDRTSYQGFIDDTRNIDDYINKYLYGYLPDAERKYSVATGDQYKELYNSKDTLITVFGDSGCTYCEQLEKVINQVAIAGKYNIYYMNFSNMTDIDKEAVYDLDISIPAECTKDGDKDRPLIDGYSKPTTIVSKKGKIIGCIKGYYDYKTYLSKLDKIMEG